MKAVGSALTTVRLVALAVAAIEEIVSATGPALAPDVDQEDSALDLGHGLVVVERGNRAQDVRQERQPGRPDCRGREQNPHPAARPR